MAPAAPVSRAAASDDELDDILNGVIDGDDIFDTSNIQPQTPLQAQTQPQQRPTTTDANLGIDEEIKIEKKRQPIPKLDVERLLSPAGIPRLQRISKDRLRFKGKGHEYGDIARMLNMYQLWLDDLYPRAKFGDALAIIEKLGHTKHMQIYRKEWINNSKPKHHSDSEVEADEDRDAPAESIERNTEQMEGLQLDNADREGSHQTRDQAGASDHIMGEDGPDDDELDALLAETTTSTFRAQKPIQRADDGGPDEDELDALLAESVVPSTATSAKPPPKSATTEDDPFAADMEAMAEMEDMF